MGLIIFFKIVLHNIRKNLLLYLIKYNHNINEYHNFFDILEFYNYSNYTKRFFNKV